MLSTHTSLLWSRRGAEDQDQVYKEERLLQTRSMQAAQKTALIVYAHQTPNSFNAAVRDVTMQEMSEQGYRVIVSDLYAMNFKASTTRDDIIGDLKNPELFQYGEETLHAWMEGRLCDEVVAEQRKVEEAEVIIFQFPLYWYSVPAIMKGWLDRVLTTGFAFSLQAVCNASLKKKKTVLSFTTGPIRTIFSPDEDINMKLWHLQHGTLSGCGFQVLAPQIFWCPTVAPLATRTSMLNGWRARLKGLMAEEPLTFDPCVFLNVSSHEEFLMLKEKELEPSSLETGNHLTKNPLSPDDQIKAQPAGENKEKSDSRN